MKVTQKKLLIGTEGKVLIDSTNIKSNSGNKNKKKPKNDIENLQSSKVKRVDSIYADPPTTVKKPQKFSNASTQTESYESTDVKKCSHNQNIINMMTNDETPSENWEALAEERRFALEVALEENRMLVVENEHLKEENEVLEEMLQEAKQLATLVQEITDAEENTKESSSVEELPEGEKTNSVDAST